MNASGYITAGEKFKPSARVWNRLVDLQKRLDGREVADSSNKAVEKPVTVYVTSGAAGWNQGDVVGIGDAVTTPETDEWVEWRHKQVYAGVEADNAAPWGIVTGPGTAVGELATVCLFGTVAAVVTVSDAAHRYAHIDGAGALVSGMYGQARIVWAAPEPEESETHTAGEPWDAWCLLALGDGLAAESLPFGMVRLYRGASTVAEHQQGWLKVGLAVYDSDSKLLGYEISTGTPASKTICIPQEDLPNPYTSAVPDGIANEDRTDYCIAAVGGVSTNYLGTGPFQVPSTLTSGAFSALTLSELRTLLDTAAPSATQIFQKANVWASIGDNSFMQRVDGAALCGAGNGIVIDTNGRVRLDATVPTTVGTNPVALCATGGGATAFQEIVPGTGGGGGGAEYASATPAIVIAGTEEVPTIGLLGDATDSEGVYYADGESGRAFVPLAGSVKLSDEPEIILEGDEAAPTTGTDQLLYTYDRSPALDADKKRKWVKKFVAQDPIEEIVESGVNKLRLKTAFNEGIPTDAGYYCYVIRRNADASITPYWGPTVQVQV